MKTKKFALLIILSMLVTGFAGAGSYIVEDDIYYNPNDKNPVVEKKEKDAQKELQEKAAVKKTLMATSDNHFRDVDEYNRRGESSDMTLEDIAANQKEDHVEYNVVDENGDDGYYLNGFNGSDSDYEYALRIRRFHNPKFVVSVSDPFYSDIYFLDNNDWNVYISDNYAWVTPTWTNPWYWNYTWAPYSYTSWSWRWSLGPWGFSFGYDPFYSWGGYWGWDSWYRPPEDLCLFVFGRNGLWYLPDLPVSPQAPVQMLYVSKSSPLILAFVTFFYFNKNFKNSFIFHLPQC